MAEHGMEPTAAERDPIEAALGSLATAPVPEALSAAVITRVRAEGRGRPASRSMVLSMAAALAVVMLVSGAGLYAWSLHGAPAAAPTDAPAAAPTRTAEASASPMRPLSPSAVLQQPYPLPLTVIDHSRTFTGVEDSSVAEGTSVITGELPRTLRVLGDDASLFLAWIGGGCDDRVTADIDSYVRRIDVVTVTGTEPCDLIGYQRIAKLSFDHPIVLEGLSVTSISVASSWSIAPDPASSWPLPIRVNDRSGSLVRAEAATEAEISPWTSKMPDGPFVVPAGANRSQLLLGWPGGACDDHVSVGIGPRVKAISVETAPLLPPQEQPPFLCPAVAIERFAKLTFDHEVTAADITVSVLAFPNPSDPLVATPTPEATQLPRAEPGASPSPRPSPGP